MHDRWRERAADLAELRPGDRALDVATGTGDLAIELERRVGPSGEVVGVDFAERMLELARAKAPGIRFEQGNALELGFDDGEFDAVTVGFGARNFSDLRRGLAEMARVAKPGGRVVVLEITTPQKPPLSVVLLALVRPRGAGPGPAGGRPGRLHLPAELGPALPGPTRAGRRAGAPWACGTCAGS